MSKGQASGRLFENRIVIWDIETSRRLFREGYYGKPLGIPKPKDFEFNAPLILDLMESYYLVKKKRLRVEGEEEGLLTAKEVEALCADRKSTRLNSSHSSISYAVFCLKKKKKT